MFSLMLALAVLAQNSQYVADYKPKVGDKLVLACDLIGRRVPVFKSEGAAGSSSVVLKDDDDGTYETLLGGDEIAEAAFQTSVQVISINSLYKNNPIAGIRYLAGPSKGKTAYIYGKYCRKLDPARINLTTEDRKKRGPLDKMAVIKDLKDAFEKTKPNEATVDLNGKKKLVRESAEAVGQKHEADFAEVLDVANAAGVSVSLNAKEYDIAGNPTTTRKL